MVIYCHQSRTFPEMLQDEWEHQRSAQEDKELKIIWNKQNASRSLVHLHNQNSAPTCKACMSKVTKLVGPPLEIGIFDKILARVKAVATSPSSSIRSDVPVGKNGRTRVNEETKSFGNAYITDNCSNMTPGELNEARNATCCPRIPGALDMNKLGNPSSNVLN